MPSNNERAVGYGLLVMASVVIVLAGVKSASVIVVPFLLSLFLAIILSPLFFWFHKRGMPQWLALLLTVTVMIGAMLLLAMLVGNSIHDFSQNLPAYKTKLHDDLQHLLPLLQKYHLTIPKEDFSAMFAADSVMEYIARSLKSLAGLMTNSLMIILTVVFMLLEISQFSKKLQQIGTQGFNALNQVSATINHFMMLKSATSLATGVLIAIALSLLDINYAILWGVVAFLFNFIPNIGSIIAAVPAVLMAMVQYDIAAAAMVTGVYLVVNVVIGSILEPRIMGKGLGLSPLIVFLSLIFWGWLLGPVGMLLSVPLTIMVKIVLDAKEDTRWIAIFLGN